VETIAAIVTFIAEIFFIGLVATMFVGNKNKKKDKKDKDGKS
jgi:hypothetical protein